MGSQGPLTAKRSFLRVQDFAWLLFVVILIVPSPEVNYDATILLTVIGGYQIIEPRLRVFRSTRGRMISLALKLMLSFLLIGWSHTIYSYYYQIFLIPVVSAATTFEIGAVILTVTVAGLLYFSFLLPVFYDYSRLAFPFDQVNIMALRVAFFAIVAFLVYEQARAKREEMLRTEEAARKLAESTKNLQEMQVSLRRSERLAALGQLTAGLAHELRNPLGTIKGSAEMLTKEFVDGKPEVRAELAGYIGSEVNRMNGLIGSFLNFARPLQIHEVLSDVDAMVEDVLREHVDLAKERSVELLYEKDSEPCHFQFDPQLLKAAVSNLVQNAIQASEASKKVKIRREQNAGMVKIAVLDEGQGIATQNVESIFNPFFTTKPQGVGLGLAIVAKIVDEHLGTIQVRSKEGEGACFEIILPRKGEIR